MAKMDFESDYIWKFINETKYTTVTFINDLDTEATLLSCLASIWDSSGINKTASMLSSPTVTSPSAEFSITKGTIGETYELKVTGFASASAVHIHKIICEVFDSISLNTKLGDPAANSYVTLPEANTYIRNVLGHPNKWDTLSVEGRKRLLIEACRDIDRFNFLGVRYYDNQILEFPRNDHDTITGNCGTPLTNTGFKHANFTSDTYGSYKSNTNYWKYGAVHITLATPLNDIRVIGGNNITTNVVTVASAFTATPTTNTTFIAFEPLDTKIKSAQCHQALYILENSGGDTLQNYKDSGANYVKIGDTEVRFKEGLSSRSSISQEARKLLSPWIRKDKKVLRG